MTNGLSWNEILLKYYDCLGLNFSKELEMQYSFESSSISSNCSWRDLCNTDSIKRSLFNRKKNEKLSEYQIKFLRDQINYSGFSLREISSTYFVSLSNLRRIKNLTLKQISKGPARPPLRPPCRELHGIRREIKFYNKNCEFPYTVGDVKQYLDDTNNKDNPPAIIRKVMINDMNLSFKLCKSRPLIFNIAKVKAARKLFWVYFTKRLEPSTLIINIDESTFSRTSKINYSWSKKGSCAELKNTPFSGSTSMILAILSNGFWMCLLTPQTINSDVFALFIGKLKEWVSECNNFDYANVILTLDNCSSHQSSKSKENLKKLGYLIAYLPQYSPQLAPVEMAFSLIKRKLKNQAKHFGLNLSQVINYDEFRKWLLVLTKERVRSMFKEFSTK